jgi:hypothetical protein
VDLWDVYQHVQIASATATADSARQTAETTHQKTVREISRLEAKIDGLSLISQALWELARERMQLTEEDILAKVKEIDARDGRVDGRIGGLPGECAQCRRPTHSRQTACMYCGTPISRAHVFER